MELLCNYVARFYVFAIKSVRELQATLYAHAKQQVETMESRILSLLADPHHDPKTVTSLLTQLTIQEGSYVSDHWRDIFPVILTTYRDGFVMKVTEPTIAFERMFYPRWWLEAVGYFNIPGNKGGILFEPNPQAAGGQVSVFAFWSGILLSIALTTMVCSLLNWRKERALAAEKRFEYVELPVRHGAAAESSAVFNSYHNSYAQSDKA